MGEGSWRVGLDGTTEIERINTMEVGIIGLGRMGAGMSKRWLRGGHRVVGYNRSPGPVKELEAVGGIGAYSMEALVDRLTAPRAIWIMLPAGEVTEQAIKAAAPLLAPGDTIVDGGNTNFHDDIRRAAELKPMGINYVDQGTSGGIWGLEVGFSLMVGGEPDVVRRLEPAFLTLAPENGYGHMGPVGAGHFVKMVHNGIEYGMMEAYAEGFAMMVAKQEFNLDLARVARVWNHGSVIRSWLLELAEEALKGDPTLSGIAPYVADSGEGRWSVKESVDLGIPAPVITLALQMRFVSQQENPFAARLLAALRQQFGGHPIKKVEPEAATSVE
ncbi:MAG TPA: decarboxylating 6-phosphogluconate dehydrogenase [Chloroflexi bacterium]|nr:decarboxylating 6-phosphogluconate dehydrogenase [Chloroflexota bacterium]